jgi:hypothetical protein
MTTNPYAPPKAIDDDRPPVQTAAQAPLLWNPNAASNWSLAFTPAFGAYLHMLNWRALGQTEKAASARVWFVMSLIVLGIALIVPYLLPARAVARVLGLPWLLVWYFLAAREQAKYVNDRFGKGYPRKPWGKALGLAALAGLGYSGIAVALGAMLGAPVRG